MKRKRFRSCSWDIACVSPALAERECAVSLLPKRRRLLLPRIGNQAFGEFLSVGGTKLRDAKRCQPPQVRVTPVTEQH